MSQFQNIIRLLLKFLVAYTVSLIELFCQLFWFYKKKEDQHKDLIVINEQAKICRKLKRKGLLQKLKRFKLGLLVVVDFEQTTFQKLENESDQMIMENVVNKFAYVRTRTSRWVKKAKKVFLKFKRLRVVSSQNSSLPSSPKCLFNMLPLELWEAVANHSGDPETWMNIYNMNPVLNTFLQKNRTVALIPEVLKIVYRNVSRNVMGLTELSRCRLVCKTWKQSVDLLLSDQQIRLEFCREYSSGMMTWTCNKHPTSLVYSFMPEFPERLLLESYAGIHPFPSGHVVVNEVKELTDDTARFRLAVTNMLRKFGKDVKYFGFRNEADYNPICWYLNLTRWLRLMPNLKRLDLEFCMEGQETTCHDYFSGMLCVYRFPRIENLVVLQVENVPGSIVSCALRSNPQIQKLRIIKENNYRFPPWILPMNMNYLREFFILAYSYRDIMQLERIDSSLEAIQIETAGSTGIYNSRRVFMALEKFGESLMYLKLELRSPPDTGLFLHLPWLNELNLIFHTDIKLDFILPLKSLKRLSVQILNRRFKPSTKYEMIKFNSCIENMRESNVWSLFPQLEIVSIYAYNCRFQFKGKHTFVSRRAQM